MLPDIKAKLLEGTRGSLLALPIISRLPATATTADAVSRSGSSAPAGNIARVRMSGGPWPSGLPARAEFSRWSVERMRFNGAG